MCDGQMNNLPKKILRKTSGLSWVGDTAGKSDSNIRLFDDMVLKIEKTSRSSEREKNLLEWLDGKLPVPKIIEAENRDGYSFLLMTRLPGDMICTGGSLKNMDASVVALADGLKRMWEITNCPFRNTVADKLREARENLDSVDADDFEPETLREFSGAVDLLKYLEQKQNIPEDDLVFSHGDYTFQNVLVTGRRVTGLVDWGNGGIADRWQDIALSWRHIRNRYTKYGFYGKADYLRYEELFFSELGLEPDEEKARYFVLLDELF